MHNFWQRETLLDIRAKYAARTAAHGCELDILSHNGILSESMPAAPQQRGKRKHCEHKQKRGKKAGIDAMLKANPFRPAVLSLLLANVRSLDNKLDELPLLRETHTDWRDCCVFALMKTWLQDNIPDAPIQLERMTLFQVDTEAAISDKSWGSSLWFYIKNDWCANATLATKHCAQLAEFFIVKWQPFYLLKEFTNMIVAAVYVASGTNGG